MGLLNFKSDGSIAKLEAQLAELTIATEKVNASRKAAITDLADVDDRLGTTGLLGGDTGSLSLERASIERKLKAFDLSEAKGQAEIAKINQKLAALKSKEARQAYAAGILKLADQWEKCLLAFQKAAGAVADGYFALPESARDSFTAGTKSLLEFNIPQADAFAHGGAIEAAITDMRRRAAQVVSGECDLPTNNVTLGARLESFGRKPRAA